MPVSVNESDNEKYGGVKISNNTRRKKDAYY